MRVKSLVLLVISGCLTASMVYTAPALAEDGDNSSTIQSFASSGNDVTNGATVDNGATNSNSNPSADANNNESDTTVDQATPDTATGDDDY